MQADVRGMPIPVLADWLDQVGVGAAHAGRVFRGLHELGLEQAKGLGPRHLATVQREGWFASCEVVARHPAAGGTERLVFQLHDGARVEGVLLPNKRRPGRTTLCLSSQVGCAMACRFCATGTLGLKRNLTAGEIVAQVEVARTLVDGRLTNLVFMGMGEPLHAWSSVRDALAVLFDPHGKPFARSKVCVSTVGLPERIVDLQHAFGGKVQLALSLHAGTDATRAQIIPMAKKVPLARLKQTLVDYHAAGGVPLMVEYVLLPGVNDSDAEFDALAAWMEGVPAIVNLIPFNPFGSAPYRSPTDDEIRRAAQALRDRNLLSSVRWPRGRDANGACGQLMLAGA